MGRRLRGAGSPASLAALEPDSRVTTECSFSLDFRRRVAAIQSLTGESPGPVIERLLAPALAGIRVASVPDRLVPPGWGNLGPGKGEAAPAAEDGGATPHATGPAGQALPCPPPPPAGGGGDTPRPARRSIEEQRARFGRRNAG